MNYNIDDFENVQSDEETINWREVIEKYVVYWKWVLASVVVAVLAGAIYGYVQKDVYEFKASMLIIDQTKNGQMNQLSLLTQLSDIGMANSNTMVNNEAQIIGSSVLMKRVVDQLELHTVYLTTRSFKEIELYNSSPYYVRLDSASHNSIGKPLEFTIEKSGAEFIIEGKSGKEKFKSTVNQLPATIKTPVGLLTVVKRNGADITDHEVKVIISNPVNVARFISEKLLQVEITKQVDVIQLTMKASNVQKGKDILNVIIQLYNQDAIEQLNRSANYTAMFIDGRLKLLTGELSDVEVNLESYKKENNFTNIEANAQLFLSSSSLYEKERLETDIQLQLIKYVEQYINDPANTYALIPNLGLTDVGLVAVVQKYNELIMTRERIAQGSSENNPALVTMNQNVQAARRMIQESVVSSRNGLQIASKGLAQQNTMLQSRLSNIPRQEREFIEIKRQQQVKETLYLFLLQKREEASLSMAVAAPKGRVLNAPDDAKLVAPRAKVIVAVFFLLGLAIPIGIISIKQIIYTKITNRKDVERLTKVPVLSILGHNDSGSTIVNHKETINTNAELFRLLRAKLQFSLDYPTEKVLLVTSTEPGEGKTFVSANLAISLSMTDKKVVLVGLDMRKPMMSRNFGITEQTGMSLYLSGQENDLHKLVQKVSDYPNLDLIPAGIIPPNPNELIMKDRLDNLFAELRSKYDYVVIDTAPVGAVSDTFLIDRVSDMTIYVCRADYSDKRNIDFLNYVKKEGSLKKLNLVINDIDFEAHSYSYHGKYGYGYGYGKGYGTSV